MPGSLKYQPDKVWCVGVVSQSEKKKKRVRWERRSYAKIRDAVTDAKIMYIHKETTIHARKHFQYGDSERTATAQSKTRQGKEEEVVDGIKRRDSVK